MEPILYLQISEARMEEIRRLIVDILRDSGAKCGILIDTSGHPLVRKGFTLIREIDNLCALIAASRATTRAIARILGQDEISVIFHQGAGDHLHSTDVGERAILTLIFDDRADLAQIQAVASERVRLLIPMLEPEAGGEDKAAAGLENLQDRADKRLDALFHQVHAAGESADF